MTSHFRSTSFLAALAFTLGALAGCEAEHHTQEGAGATDPAEESPPAPTNEPGSPTYTGKTMSCEDREALIAACNLYDTRLVNIAANRPDVFAPTPQCEAQLLAKLPFDASWQGEDEKIALARSRMLAGVHALLFYPLLVPKDRTLIWPAGGDPEAPAFTAQFYIGHGVQDLPDDRDLVVTAKYVNEKILDLVYGEVTAISLVETGEGEGTHMQTTDVGGHVEVVRSWVSGKTGSLYNRDAVAPLIIARSFLHEARHAKSTVKHDACDQHYGFEVECDDNLGDTAYGLGGEVGQALVLGAMYSRVADDAEAKMIVPEGVLGSFYVDNCDHLVSKVNDVGEWVRKNDAYGACASSFVAEGLRQRVSPSAAPLPQPDALLPWMCSDSVNELVKEK